MGNENGEWILHGMAKNDPARLKTPEEALDFINEVGILPLFANTVPGFSLEEHTYGPDWWSDDPARDPWAWRQVLARSGKVVYGKFFDRKAGFVSLDLFPDFANARRDGYDFDSRVDQGIATRRQRKIMDCFREDGELYSFELKQRAGFGKGGEKNFEGTLSALEESTYLVVSDFRQRTNKQGRPYGWHIALYTPPETRWGYDFVTGAYRDEPSRSWERILNRVRARYPDAGEAAVAAILR